MKLFCNFCIASFVYWTMNNGATVCGVFLGNSLYIETENNLFNGKLKYLIIFTLKFHEQLQQPLFDFY
jgi:hypothetical protein